LILSARVRWVLLAREAAEANMLEEGQQPVAIPDGRIELNSGRSRPGRSASSAPAGRGG
jgi:hypothetical protein